MTLRRKCAVTSVLPSGKTSAQGGFTAQPLVALPPYGCGVPLAGICPGAFSIRVPAKVSAFVGHTKTTQTMNIITAAIRWLLLKAGSSYKGAAFDLTGTRAFPFSPAVGWGLCPLRGRWGRSFQEKGCSPLPGEVFSLSGKGGCAPHFFFSLLEKKKRASVR